MSSTDLKARVVEGDSDTQIVQLDYDGDTETGLTDTDLVCGKAAEYVGRLSCPVGFLLRRHSSLLSAQDLFKGVRCVPAETDNDHLIAAPLTRRAAELDGFGVMNTTQYTRKETGFKVYQPAVEKRRRNKKSRMLSERQSWVKLNQTAEAAGLPGAVRHLEGTGWLSPIVSFGRSSCQLQPISSLSWKESEEGVPVPICREIQTLRPFLYCSGTSRVKCRSMEGQEKPGEQDAQLRMLVHSGSEPRKLLESEDPSFRLSATSVAINSCLETAVCEHERIPEKPIATCASPRAVLTDRLFHQVEEALGDSQITAWRDGDAAGSDVRVKVCVEVEQATVNVQCPFGIGRVASQSGRCEVLLSQPLEVSCPEGFTRGSHDLKGDKKEKKHSVTEVLSGPPNSCELLEYADYQISCPGGYRRERAKNTAQACIAEKAIPPSPICPPGFVATSAELNPSDPRGCQKSIEVAPTIISLPTESFPGGGPESVDGALATACVLTKDKKLSCGVERKYHGAVEMKEQLEFGQAYKKKFDHKQKKHLEKYTANN